jgi:hypothetical protein
MKKPPLDGGFIKTDVCSKEQSSQRDVASKKTKPERETTRIVHVIELVAG